MKIHPAARATGRKTLKTATNKRSNAFPTHHGPVTVFCDRTATKSSASPSTPFINAFGTPSSDVLRPHRPKKPSPVLGGSPIKKHRRKPSSTKDFKGSPQASTAPIDVMVEALPAELPPAEYLTNDTTTVLSLRAPGGIDIPQPQLLPQHVINAHNAPYITDPLDQDLHIDLTQIYIDANGQYQSTQYLPPRPINFMDATAHRNNILNYSRRFTYGMTRTGEERFWCQAMHQQPIRLMSTSTSGDPPPEISVEQYHELADQYIESLVTMLEEIESYNEEVDVEYSAGVVTVTFPPHGVYVLNKQPPNKQIWLSSPISGPFRFDYREVETKDFAEKTICVGKWVDRREGTSLSALLEKELKEILPLEGEGLVWDKETKRFVDKRSWV